MKKQLLTKEELLLLQEHDCVTSDKAVTLQKFINCYTLQEEVKSKWFDTYEEYERAIKAVSERDKIAKQIVLKLNMISDKDWKKQINN